MKLALGFNPILPLKAAAAVAAKAEVSGYDSVWMQESLLQRDVVTYISAMAAATDRIRIGSGGHEHLHEASCDRSGDLRHSIRAVRGRAVLDSGSGAFRRFPSSATMSSRLAGRSRSGGSRSTWTS